MCTLLKCENLIRVSYFHVESSESYRTEEAVESIVCDDGDDDDDDVEEEENDDDDADNNNHNSVAVFTRNRDAVSLR